MALALLGKRNHQNASYVVRGRGEGLKRVRYEHD
jgi:hypothetical protein